MRLSREFGSGFTRFGTLRNFHFSLRGQIANICGLQRLATGLENKK